MHVLFMLLLAFTGLVVSRSNPDADTTTRSMAVGANGLALMQQQQWHVTSATLSSLEWTVGSKVQQVPSRNFLGGAATVAGSKPCSADGYQPSHIESQWTMNVLNWTGAAHCSHMTEEVARSWIQENKDGSFDPTLFSKVCRKGLRPQFIEPLAGVLRDPRFACYEETKNELIMSTDWLVFPDAQARPSGSKARFYDAGGSHFSEALQFFLHTYQGHGIVFDEVYVWEMSKQGADTYWRDVDSETRAFWEPRLTFYDGIGVTAEKGAEHNPVSRIFNSCAPEDFCAFKLDIDTPQVELPLIEQLLGSPNETQSKLDELFFEHHVVGVLQPWWGSNVLGTYEDSYNLFGSLRKLGVRAHSWV